MKDALDSSARESEMISVRKWLHPDSIESDAQYRAALKQRQPGTGTWLPNTSQFQSWENDQGGSYFWLYGIGKFIFFNRISPSESEELMF